MSVEKKVPEIRFKGFSGDWLNNPIGEICGSTFGGGTPSTSEKSFWQGDIPWIQSSDLKEGSVNSVTAKKHITKAGVNKSATKLVSGNSIAIVTRVGVGKLSLMESEYATSQDFLSLSDLKVDTQYSAYVIWKLLQIEKEQVQGTSIKGITKEELLSKTISFPEAKLEQIAIGNTFQKLDNLISQHQQKHDQLINIKKAMLEKMFPKQGETTPEIRFKGFSGEWEESSLAEVAVVTTGYPFDSADFSEDGDLLVITNGNIQNCSSAVDGKVGNRIASIKVTSLIQYRLNLGDILVTMDGSVGRTAKVIDRNQILAQRVGRLVARKNTEFLYQSLNTGAFLETMSTISHGGTIKHISLSEIGSYIVQVPKDLDEQAKIGGYLKKLDELIEQHQNQITKLNNIKQACLSKMFV